jgi:tetratricopeptide (TPR) repeat protein
MLYYKIRDSRTAIRYYKDANAIAPNPKSFLSIALAYSDVDSVEQGWASIRKAEMLMRTFGTASADELMLQFVCGKLHFAQNPDSAQARFHKSLRLARSGGDRRMEAENLVNLARIHLNKQSWQEAEAFLLLAERISLDEKLDEILLEVLRQSIIVYTSVSDKQRLVEYQRRFIQYKEILFNSGLSFDLAKTEGEFLEKQQQKRIQVQKSTIHFQGATLKYQSLIGLVGFVILLLLFVLFYFNYSRLRRKIQIGHLLEIRVTERTNRLKESIIQSDFRRRVEEARLSKLETDASILITNAMIEIDGISGEVRGCTSKKYLKMTSFTLKNPPPEHKSVIQECSFVIKDETT